MARSYTREEVDEILRRALAQGELGDQVSHEDLLEAAREVGIDPAEIDRAARELEAKRKDRELLAAAHAKRRRAFFRSLLKFVVVIAFLAVLDLATGGALWVHWVALVWAMVLALRGMKVLTPSADEEERILRREHKRLRKEQQRESARQMQAAVQQGVAAFLDAIGRRLEQAGAPPARPAARGDGVRFRAPAVPPRERRDEVEDAEIVRPADPRSVRRTN